MKDNQKNLVLKVTGAIQIINTENKSIYQKLSSTATRKSYGTRPFRGLGSTRKKLKIQKCPIIFIFSILS